jgi:hypothetical protein
MSKVGLWEEQAARKAELSEDEAHRRLQASQGWRSHFHPPPPSPVLVCSIPDVPCKINRGRENDFPGRVHLRPSRRRPRSEGRPEYPLPVKATTSASRYQRVPETVLQEALSERRGAMGLR